MSGSGGTLGLEVGDVQSRGVGSFQCRQGSRLSIVEEGGETEGGGKRGNMGSRRGEENEG